MGVLCALCAFLNYPSVGPLRSELVGNFGLSSEAYLQATLEKLNWSGVILVTGA